MCESMDKNVEELEERLLGSNSDNLIAFANNRSFEYKYKDGVCDSKGKKLKKLTNEFLDESYMGLTYIGSYNRDEYVSINPSVAKFEQEVFSKIEDLSKDDKYKSVIISCVSKNLLNKIDNEVLANISDEDKKSKKITAIKKNLIDLVDELITIYYRNDVFGELPDQELIDMREGVFDSLTKDLEIRDVVLQ